MARGSRPRPHARTLVPASAVAVLIAVALAVAPAGAATGDWSSYLFDARRGSYGAAVTAITPANASSLHVAWSWTPDPPTAPGQPAAQLYASPTVANGAVYIGAATGDLYSLDEASGTVNWRRPFGFTPHLTCRARGITSTATVAPDPSTGGDTVYVGAPDGYLYALRADTGATRWRARVVAAGTASANTGYIWGSPAVAGGHVYIGISSNCDDPLVRGGLREYAQATGALQHTYFSVPSGSVGGSIWTSAAITPNGGSVFVSTGNSDPTGGQAGDSFSLVKLSGSTLARQALWTVPGENGTDYDFGASPALFSATLGGTPTPMVGACNKNGSWYALRQGNLSAGPVWTRQLSDPPVPPSEGVFCFASAVWDGTRLFLGSVDTSVGGTAFLGSVRRVNPATGAYLWQRGLPGHVAGTPALNGSGVLAVGTWTPGNAEASDAVFLLNASTGAILATVSTGGDPVFAQPVMAGPYLFVATQDDGLVAYTP